MPRGTERGPSSAAYAATSSYAGGSSTYCSMGYAKPPFNLSSASTCVRKSLFTVEPSSSTQVRRGCCMVMMRKNVSTLS